ncbi:MAG: hypothetical protein A4E19_12250 [Nitrospira sp. SG-bin1]|nr:MAG: hypothetical protein A4E19_12250 [Nitrospira sp. SG-bin1]
MRYVLHLIVMVLVWGNMEVVHALDTGSRESLRGIFGVGLVVEEVGPDASADGLSQDAIRTAVEQTLRSKGIRVLTERTRSGSAPYLYVNVNTLKEQLGLYVYAVNVDLKQIVGLLTGKGKQAWGATWSASVIGMAREENLSQVIAEGVEPLVTDFANDFLSVNTRLEPAPRRNPN